MSEKQKPRTPGPFWIWLIAAIVVAQVVKRGIIGWDLPTEFDFGSRFLENLVANILYGLPVLLLYLVLYAIMNAGKKSED